MGFQVFQLLLQKISTKSLEGGGHTPSPYRVNYHTHCQQNMELTLKEPI